MSNASGFDKVIMIFVPGDASVLLASFTGRIYRVISTLKGGLRIEPVDKKNDESLYLVSDILQCPNFSSRIIRMDESHE